MAILKLVPGREHAIAGAVQYVTLEPSKNPKFGDQYKVEFATGDCVYLPKDGYERQVARLNKLPNELDGEVVTFWKKPMDTDPTKGFLNIELGNKPSGVRVAEAARNDDHIGRDLRNAGLPVAATSYEQIKDTYVACLGDAVAILQDTTETLGVPFTPAEITAAAATLFIERNRKGV
jgi:hypothetical protein